MTKLPENLPHLKVIYIHTYDTLEFLKVTNDYLKTKNLTILILMALKKEL